MSTRALYDNITAMITRDELFQETESKIEETTETLRLCFLDLGERVYNNLSLLPMEMGVKLLEETRKADKERTEAHKKEDEDKEFVSVFDEKRKRKNEVDEKIETLRIRERDVRLRLGALIYEQCSLGLLDRGKFSSVYADADEERSLSEKAEGKSFLSRFTSKSALSRLKKSDSSRYLDYSSLADNDENAVTLGGENAQCLVEELRMIKEERAVLDEEHDTLEVYLSENIAKRRVLEKGGLEKDEEEVCDREDALRESLINYGNYLFDRGGSWIGEDTPSDILDILQKILETQNEYSCLNKRKAQLQREAKADDYKALIEDEKEKIRILEGERNKIALQIEDIEKEISRLESLVERLVK